MMGRSARNASVLHRTILAAAAMLVLLGLPLSALRDDQQSAAKKPTSPAFVCPDLAAAKSCKSFIELHKAGDEGVRSSVSNGGVAYVCFRQPEDEFFVLVLDGPAFFKKHLDLDTKKLVPDDDATASGRGAVRGFVNGIQDYAAVPINSFSGEWTALFGEMSFAARRINLNNIVDAEFAGIYVDEQQVNASFRYKNRFEKAIDYRLAIQRSTGRFSEKYTDESAKVPFSERTGRCSRIPMTSPR
jgi:hypothetical protein